jgi:periplasmic copper chaperone A
MSAAPRRAAFAAAQVFARARQASALVALALLACPALARDYTAGSLTIEHPYARPTPPGARTGAVYFTIRNAGREADRLVEVASPAAQTVEMHTMTMDGNMMRMRPVAGIDIPAGGTVALAQGGYHVMFVGLAHSFSAGDQVPVTLTFAKAGPVQIAADVEAPSAEPQHKH